MAQMTIYESDGKFFVPLDENLKLLKEHNEALKENEELLKEVQFLKNDGAVWASGLDWLKEQTGIRSNQILMSKLLGPYQHQLSVEFGGFVKYPKANREPWQFCIRPMQEFLNEHFAEIMTKGNMVG